MKDLGDFTPGYWKVCKVKKGTHAHVLVSPLGVPGRWQVKSLEEHVEKFRQRIASCNTTIRGCSKMDIGETIGTFKITPTGEVIGVSGYEM